MALNIPTPKTFLQSYLDTGKEMAEQDLRRSQAKREEAKANLPFGGQQLPGAAGQVQGLEMMKGLYGENSPQYKQALNAFNLGQEGVQSRVNYQNVLAGSAGKRFSTPLAKSLQEVEDISNGYLPGTKTRLSPEQAQEYHDRYGLDILKKTTDPVARKQNLAATNMDITLNSIDPNSLTQYSGLKGTAQMLKDKRDSALGKTVPRYKAYQENLTKAKALKKQVRQFYGDSITPTVQQGLDELVNPASWLKSPEIAMNNFNQFASLLRRETHQTKRAMKSPDVYTEEPQGGQQGVPQGGDDLDRMAQEAIQKGADPKAVQAELARLRGSQ